MNSIFLAKELQNFLNPHGKMVNICMRNGSVNAIYVHFAGLYDMVGNIWEWTSTVFGKDPQTKMDQYALRGGCYIDSLDGSFNHKADVTTRLVLRTQ